MNSNGATDQETAATVTRIYPRNATNVPGRTPLQFLLKAVDECAGSYFADDLELAYEIASMRMTAQQIRRLPRAFEVGGMNVWTAADQAELDALLWELTGSWFKHRHTCDERPCPHLREAIDVVLEWRQTRKIMSTAEELRMAQVERWAA